ncbi:MAG: ATP-binding protein [Anaerolineales bacterium]
MRSISVKITLVLVVVSLAGSLFTAFYIQNHTKNAFDNFIKNQDQQVLAETLTDYYQENQSWDGVDEVFKGVELYSSSNYGAGESGGNNPNRPFDRSSPSIPFVLALDSGLIIAGGTSHAGYQTGDTLPEKELMNGQKLENEGKIIGWLITGPTPQLRNNIQQSFLNTVQQGLITSSLVTLLIALILGGILILSFTRPIRKLAEATSEVAGGKLGYQVDITSKDELGKLATSFNSMSADLDKADKTRKQMTADIAHDLRTPLSVLHGYTEAMSEGKLSGNPDMYRVMHQQAQHLNYLIDDLRTLSLLDSGELNFQIQNINPSFILQQTTDAFHPIAREKEIELTLNIKQDMPRVNLDPDRLTQVLGNLVNNAVHILSAGGKINITAGLDKDSLVIQVTDDGPGIQAEDLPQIFDRFYRADKSRQPDEGSSGLGLAITKNLVEAQGGTITAKSEPGKETTFTITFPVE